MKSRNFSNATLINVIQNERVWLPASIISLVLLIFTAIIHFSYPVLDRQIEFLIAGNLNGLGYAFFEAITELGNIELVIPIASLILVFLIRKSDWNKSVHLLLTVFGGAVFGFILKVFFAQLVNPAGLNWPTRSELGFPSGHSMMAMLLYGWVTLILSRFIREQKRARQWAVISSGLFLIFIIGVSRLMISVHFFTDVASGWAAGGLWLAVSSLVSVWISPVIVAAAQRDNPQQPTAG